MRFAGRRGAATPRRVPGPRDPGLSPPAPRSRACACGGARTLPALPGRRGRGPRAGGGGGGPRDGDAQAGGGVRGTGSAGRGGGRRPCSAARPRDPGGPAPAPRPPPCREASRVPSTSLLSGRGQTALGHNEPATRPGDGPQPAPLLGQEASPGGETLGGRGGVPGRGADSPGAIGPRSRRDPGPHARAKRGTVGTRRWHSSRPSPRAGPAPTRPRGCAADLPSGSAPAERGGCALRRGAGRGWPGGGGGAEEREGRGGGTGGPGGGGAEGAEAGAEGAGGRAGEGRGRGRGGPTRGHPRTLR